MDLGTLNWNYASERAIFYTQDLSTNIFKPGDDKTAKVLCSAYRYVAYINLADNTVCIGSPSGMLYIKDLRFTDATAFKTSVNGQQLVYELATPIIIPLGSVAISSLLWVNNIFANSGDILNAEYKRDATTIINQLINRIIALEERG